MLWLYKVLGAVQKLSVPQLFMSSFTNNTSREYYLLRKVGQRKEKEKIAVSCSEVLGNNLKKLPIPFVVV